jgi:hypothetical protein
MSLIQKKQFSIGRAERNERDDRVFVVATEDSHAPKVTYKQGTNFGCSSIPTTAQEEHI